MQAGRATATAALKAVSAPGRCPSTDPTYPPNPPTREHGLQRLDGVREGDGHAAQADVGQRIAQRVHRGQRGDAHGLQMHAAGGKRGAEAGAQ